MKETFIEIKRRKSCEFFELILFILFSSGIIAVILFVFLFNHVQKHYFTDLQLGVLCLWGTKKYRYFDPFHFGQLWIWTFDWLYQEF